MDDRLRQERDEAMRLLDIIVNHAHYDLDIVLREARELLGEKCVVCGKPLACKGNLYHSAGFCDAQCAHDAAGDA